MLPLVALLAGSSGSARAAEAFGDSVYYFGDLHGHTGYSGDAVSSDMGRCLGACGSFSGVFSFAQAEGLDFLALADHVNGFRAMTATQWDTFHAAVLAHDDPAGGFVTIPAAELWFYTSGTTGYGHKTLLMFGDDTALAPVRIDDVRPSSSSNTPSCAWIWSWADTLAAAYGDILLIPHHPATAQPLPADFSCHDADYEPAVEIYSRHGNSLEGDSGWDVPTAGVVASGYASNAIDPESFGIQFGFLGGTDSHDSRPGDVCALDTQQLTHSYGGGLTVVMLDASDTFDRPAIHDAIVAHHTYTTSGPHFALSMEWSVDGVVMGGLGDDFEIFADDDLDVSVSLPTDEAAYVDSVELVGPDGTWTLDSGGSGTWTGTVTGADVSGYLYARVTIDGDAYYGTGVCHDGGADSLEFLWSSPSYISFVPEDVDGDGLKDTEGDCDDDDPSVYPGAYDAPYDGVDADCAGDSDYDADGDGDDSDAWGGDDCDDTDATVGPTAGEVWYDGVDSDCSAGDDYDADADGYDASDYGGDDCDDTDADVHPGAAEVWYDGADSDCDGASDFDYDGDGFEALSEGGEDCDDTDASVSPIATETWYDGVDGDCDGGSDFDADFDGFEADTEGGEDCDDTTASVAPSAVDTCADGVDQDCDGEDSATTCTRGVDTGVASARAESSSADSGTADTAAPADDSGTASGTSAASDSGVAAADSLIVSSTEEPTASTAEDSGTTTSAPPRRRRHHRHRPYLPDGRRPPRLNPDGSKPRLRP